MERFEENLKEGNNAEKGQVMTQMTEEMGRKYRALARGVTQEVEEVITAVLQIKKSAETEAKKVDYDE